MNLDDLQAFKREVILALFADNTLMQQLVLKGGNLLDVVYGISTRPSRDIDLSICGDIEDLDRFRTTIADALARWFAPQGYVVFDVNLTEQPKNVTAEFRAFWGGYKVGFKIIDAETYERLGADLRRLRAQALTVREDHGRSFRSRSANTSTWTKRWRRSSRTLPCSPTRLKCWWPRNFGRSVSRCLNTRRS
jgi:hypothetical protein